MSGSLINFNLLTYCSQGFDINLGFNKIEPVLSQRFGENVNKLELDFNEFQLNMPFMSMILGEVMFDVNVLKP